MQKEPSSLHSQDARFRLNSRRDFLADVGRGMLVSSVGSTLAFDLGLAPVFADEGPGRLSFGKLEPLVALMQDTPADKLQRELVGKIKAGTDLRTLIAAGALANARTFGGQDYVGFHTIMALAPAYEMSRELPEALRPLPVLKVLYRNTSRIQQFGGRKSRSAAAGHSGSAWPSARRWRTAALGDAIARCQPSRANLRRHGESAGR